MILNREAVLLKYPSYTFEKAVKIDNDYITPLTEEHCLVRQRENINTLEDVRIAVIGNVDAGKSTILGVLTKGKLDDGRGKAREVLFKHKHEQVTGRTSSVGMECMGFDEYGKQILKGEHHKLTWDEIALSSSKMVTFIDLAGHERYLKTTVYGLSSSQPDYAMLMVGANAGMIGMTKEHLGLTLLLNIPSIIVITKIDMAPENVLKSTVNQLQKILKSQGCRKLPIFVRNNQDVIKVALSFTGERVCPIFMVSNVTGEGIDLLRLFLNILPSRAEIDTTVNGPVEYEITESFSVPGVGCVVSGHLLTGTVKLGDNLLIGPDKNGIFLNTQVKGIHRKRVPISVATPGQGVSFALKKIKRNQIRKGMVLVSKEVDTSAHVTREFEAEILVLHHSTTIAVNYQTMLHSRNVRQTCQIISMSTPLIRNGDKSVVRMRFISHPEYLNVDMKILFREGRTKGIGKILRSSDPKQSLKNDNLMKEETTVKKRDKLADWINKVNILRVSGSEGNKLVRQIITQQLRKTGFEIELDLFTAKTPIGEIEFANVIGKRFKNKKKFKDQKSIILAAHYDSKYFKDGDFYGTTDSATSVGLLLNLADKIRDLKYPCDGKYHLYLVFFDGEEAFQEWNREDSVYGARHLSEKWKDQLGEFEYLILFDLLGSKDAGDGHIRRTPYTYKPVFDKLLQIDNDDDSYNILGGDTYKSFDDDHRPFMEKGVKIVHIIPHDFPKQWHTLQDNLENVDIKIMHGYDKLLWEFIIKELELENCVQ